MPKNSITILAPDAAPEHSASMDNTLTQELVILLHESLISALDNCSMLIGTQVSRDAEITELGREAIKLRSTLHKAHMRIHGAVEEANEAQEGQLALSDSKASKRKALAK